MERTRNLLSGRCRVARTAAAVVSSAMLACVALAPLPASAESTRDGWEVANDIFLASVDLVVLRPLGFGHVILGGLLLAPVAFFDLVALPIGQDQSVFSDDIYRHVTEPVEFTFKRRLGVDLAGG